MADNGTENNNKGTTKMDGNGSTPFSQASDEGVCSFFP